MNWNCSRSLVAMCCAGLGLLAAPASATFHFMQIEQVIGGVDGDTTAQAIQLRMRAAFQNLVSQGRLIAWDASGANPVIVIDFPGNVPGSSAGSRVLVTTAAFDALTAPAAVSDFTMTNAIPASYLAAGSLTFEDSTIGTIYWRLSWGGASYTGATTGSITNDPDGQFGPPWPGALPSAGVQALRFQGAANATSTSNANDYALTAGAASFTNNAGTAFTIDVVVPDCSGVSDCSGHGLCIDMDTCACDSGWIGADCATFACNGVNDCTGNGTCVGPNTCVCNEGFAGPSCAAEIPTVSQWGLVVLALALTCCGTVLARTRRCAFGGGRM